MSRSAADWPLLLVIETAPVALVLLLEEVEQLPEPLKPEEALTEWVLDELLQLEVLSADNTVMCDAASKCSV